MAAARLNTGKPGFYLPRPGSGGWCWITHVLRCNIKQVKKP